MNFAVAILLQIAVLFTLVNFQWALEHQDIQDLLAEVDNDRSQGVDDRKFDELLEKIRMETSESTRSKSNTEESRGAASAALGLQELGKLAQDPTQLVAALKDLQDPTIQQEVRSLMNDPNFKRQMKKMMDSPAFKAAMSRAASNLESLAEHPELMEKLRLASQAQVEEL
jgi:ERCC4-related helicase